jgi:hypothetical protein
MVLRWSYVKTNDGKNIEKNYPFFSFVAHPIAAEVDTYLRRQEKGQLPRPSKKT